MSNLRSLLNDDPPPSTPARPAVSRSSASQPPHSIPATASQYPHSQMQSPQVPRGPPHSPQPSQPSSYNPHPQHRAPSPGIPASALIHQHPQMHIQQNGGAHPPFPNPAPAPTSPHTSRSTAVGYSLRTRGSSKEEALPNGNHLVYPGEPPLQSRGPPHPYPNGSALDDEDGMDVDEHPQARSKRASAVAANGKFGSTGRTNFVRVLRFDVPRIDRPANPCLRSLPPFRTNTDRAYFSSLSSSGAPSSLLVRSRRKYKRVERCPGAVCPQNSRPRERGGNSLERI